MIRGMFALSYITLVLCSVSPEFRVLFHFRDYRCHKHLLVYDAVKCAQGLGHYHTLSEYWTKQHNHRLFFAKTKIMAKALGLTPDSEHLPGLHKLTKHLHGDVGLLCSPRSPTSILSHFSTYAPTDFARAGTTATYTFTLPSGIIHSQGGQIPSEEDQPIQHSTEPMLRKWGLPTRLEKGRVVLDEEYTVCEEGKVLDSHQTALLKFFGVAMAEFKVKVVAYWTAEGGEVTEVEEGAMEE